MAPDLRSARTNDIPSVLSPGKTEGLTGMVANPVSVKFPGDFTPEKTKSSVVASDEFLQGRIVKCSVLMKPNFGFGIQKSWIGSGSEASAA